MAGFGGTTARTRFVVYWITTALLTGELVVGGFWDILRVPEVRQVTERLGYPSYVLVILGCWKLLGAVALLAPGRPRLKEWAYAGAVFADTTALASHLWKRYGYGEVAVLIALLAITATSWTSRPASRSLRAGFAKSKPICRRGRGDHAAPYGGSA